jgi:hypothetical protein
MVKNYNNKKRQRGRKNGRTVAGKKSWSFSRRQKKFIRFVLCNEGVWVKKKLQKKNPLNFF